MSRQPILSIKQPFAHFVIYGGKDVENRTWKTNYRGLLHVHAGKAMEELHSRDIFLHLVPDGKFGGIIGTVELVDIVNNSTSRWATPGRYHWVLENPKPVEFVKMRGKLGLFYYEDETILKKPRSDVHATRGGQLVLPHIESGIS